MIGKFKDNLIIIAKGYKLKNFFNNEYFKINDDKIKLFTNAFGFKNGKIVSLKTGEYKIGEYEKLLITEHLNKEKFLNDFLYEDDDFIYIAIINVKFFCKKFKTTFSSFKDAEMFFINFLKSEEDNLLLVFNELFINAYEHGNLGLCFEDKEHLLKCEKYFDYIKNKEADKEIEVCVAKKDNYYIVKITDEGEGFDLKLKRGLYNGKGIILSRKFANLFYNERGNSVLIIGRKDGL